MKAIQLHVKNKQSKQHSNTYGWQISRLRRKHIQKRSWQCHVFIDTYMHTYFHHEKPAHAMYRYLFSSIKTCKFHWKKNDIFFFVCPKHRPRAHARNASARRFQRAPTIRAPEQNYDKYVYPSTPRFYYIKVGYKGVNIARTCLPDVEMASLKRADAPQSPY